MGNYLYSGILLICAYGVGWLLYLIAILSLRRWGDAVSLKNFDISLRPFKRPLCFLIPILCILMVIPSLRLTEKERLLISYLTNAIFIALTGWAAIKVVHILRDAILHRYDIQVRDNVRARGVHTQLRMLANIVNAVIVLLTVSFILIRIPGAGHIGMSILASAGIAGIVIGFAAQKALGNLIAGIQIAIAQPVRLDDVVIVENEWGWIEEINLTFAVVRIWDLRRMVVPIAYFLEKPFQNWTRTNADLLGTVFIYADYNLPVKEIRDELLRILKESPLWDKKACGLQVTNMTEKTVELRALMSAADSSSLWDLRCAVREKLLEFLQTRFPECLPRVRIEGDKR
ncbi:MAG: mechanosensitive ion channel family protein [Candidatus Omnitrophota bacterium]